MTRCAALVRGINVGGSKKLVMAELREVLTGLGLTDVRTVLNSGNAVFRTSVPPAGLPALITAAVEAELGLRAACVVRTRTEMGAVLAGHPFRDMADNPSRMMALFLSADPPADVAAAADPRELDPGRVALGPRVIYQWCPDGVLQAPDVSTFVMRRWGVDVTGRNWNTVTRLAALLGG